MTSDTEFQSPAFKNAIRNPANPNHLMVIKPVRHQIRIYADDRLLADSGNALRVLEIGKSFYDPVIYVPDENLKTNFDELDKSTHCPIKGNASYIAINGEELGWVYKNPIEMARQLTNHYAFWSDKVRIIEGA